MNQTQTIHPLLTTVDELIAVLDTAGITVTRCDDKTANLYAWTAPDGEIVYLGKASSAKRLNDENRWKNTSDPSANIHSGFASLVQNANATHTGLHIETKTLDSTRIDATIAKDQWTGPALDTLNAAAPELVITPEMVEKIMIRTVVRMGKLIGNSQFASQWETPIGTIPDTLAHLAVIGAKNQGII